MPQKRNRRRSSDGTRQALIDAALQVVADEGMASATTRRIAEQAGLPQGLVHYWFATKDELFEQVIATVVDQLAAVASDALRQGEGLGRSVRAALEIAIADDPGRQRALYELTVHALRTPDLREVARAQYERYLNSALANMEPFSHSVGDTVPGGLPALGALITAAVDGIVLTWLATNDRDRVDQAIGGLEYLLDLLERDPTQGTPTESRL